jgi:hypothetical protein
MKRRWSTSLIVVLATGWAGTSHADGPGETLRPEAVTLTAPDLAGKSLGGWSPSGEAEEGRLYAEIEYLLWWMRRDREPALFTTGSPGDVPAGAIGQPGTDVLFGGHVGDPFHSGGRVTAGYLAAGGLGVEAGYFILEQRSALFSTSSNGAPTAPIIARPFFDFNFQHENAQIIAAPGFRAGSAEAALHQRLQGAECNLTTPGWDEGDFCLRLLTGFRFLALDESLDLGDQFTPLTPGGSSAVDVESFGTRNRFYGWQLGATAEFGEEFFVSAAAKIALGATVESIRINGNLFTSNPFTGTFAGPGGLLTQTSNIGQYHHDAFAVVPEVDVNVGYKFNPCIKTYVGYSLVAISDVARPGDQIDRVVQLPTIPPGLGVVARPLFSPRQSDFWAQGMTMGLALSY